MDQDMDDSSSPALRRRIIEDATRLFGEIGYAKTSMRALAGAAGCSKAAVYYHFGSKETLFCEAVRIQSERHGELIRMDQTTAGSLRERLVVAMKNVFDIARAHPQSLLLFYRSILSADAGQPEIDPAHSQDTLVEFVRVLLQEALDAGEIWADVDVEDATRALCGIVDRRCRLLLFEGVPIPDDCPARLADMFLNGVSSRPSCHRATRHPH